MSSIIFNHLGIFYQESENNTGRMILNFTNYLENKSRVSLHRLEGQSHCILPEIMNKYLQECKKIDSPCYEDCQLDIFLIFTLVTNQLLHTSKPIRLLEYGCNDGTLSYFLTSIMGIFNEKSRIYCLSDIIDPYWLDRIGQVEQLPDVSHIASNYGDTGLQTASFDIVVVNGTTIFENPSKVIDESINLLKDNGVLICYSKESPLLESIFQLHFEKREQFLITHNHMVQVANKKDCTWIQQPTADVVLAGINALVLEAQQWLSEGTFIEDGDKISKKLSNGIDDAILIDDRQQKQILIDLREQVLNKLLEIIH